MANNRLSELLANTEAERVRLIEERRKLVGPLDIQIQQLEAAIESFRRALRADGHAGSKAAAPIAQEDGAIVDMFLSGTSPAQLALAYIQKHPGLSSAAVIEALKDQVAARRSKSQRKVISTALYELRKRRKLVEEVNGGLVAKEVRA